MSKIIILFFLILGLASGCATIASKKENRQAAPKEARNDVETAVGRVIDTVSGKEVSSKYCPVCGRHYSASVSVCPQDGAALLTVGE